MVFTSHVFLFYFLPAVLLIYYLLPRGRNVFLTLASYVFYGWWEPWFVLLMMISTLLDYFCGGIIASPSSTARRRRMALVAAIVGDLSLLAFFKYYAFTVENLNRLLGLFGSSSLPVLSVILPIGISFYTFESMSYTIDVYRGVVRRARSLSDLACFVSSIPSLGSRSGSTLQRHRASNSSIEIIRSRNSRTAWASSFSDSRKRFFWRTQWGTWPMLCFPHMLR